VKEFALQRKRRESALGVTEMFERIKEFMSRLLGYGPESEPPDAHDRDAGIPVPVRRGPPDRNSSVAVAEPDSDE